MGYTVFDLVECWLGTAIALVPMTPRAPGRIVRPALPPRELEWIRVREHTGPRLRAITARSTR